MLATWLKRSNLVKVTTMLERSYEYRVYERMSAGLGLRSTQTRILILSTLMRSWPMILHLGYLGTLWDLNIKMVSGSDSKQDFDYDGAVYAVVCSNQTYIRRVYRAGKMAASGFAQIPKYSICWISRRRKILDCGLVVGNLLAHGPLWLFQRAQKWYCLSIWNLYASVECVKKGACIRWKICLCQEPARIIPDRFFILASLPAV